MRKTKNKYRFIFLAFLIIPAGHFVLNLLLWVNFQKVTDGHILDMGTLDCGYKHEVELFGVYGDVFAPKKYNPDVDYDIVPITCVIDPISISHGTITWENNDLLRSALISTFPDTLTFQKTVDELIATMSLNGELIKYFLFTPPSSYKVNDFELRKKWKVYIWDVPSEGLFYANTRIFKMASLPIFDPAFTSRQYRITSRLMDNLEFSIKLLFLELENRGYSEVNTVGFAALAGSTRRLDSHYYLNYKQSFFTIYESIVSSKIPRHIGKVYFVAYDNLPSKGEEEDALSGLFQLYRYSKHLNFSNGGIIKPYVVRAFPVITIFLTIFLLTHRNIKQESNISFLLKTSSVCSIASSGISIAFHFVLLTLRYNLIFCVLEEVLMAYLLYRSIIWLNELD